MSPAVAGCPGLSRAEDASWLYPPFYGVDPVFDEVRLDPRFGELVRRIERARLE